MYVHISIKLVDVHHILLKDQKVTTPRCPPKRLDIADRQSIGYTWAKTNSLQVFQMSFGCEKNFNWANLSRFRWVFCWSCYVSFRLAQSQGAVLVSQPLQLNCTWQSCVRHQPYPGCDPTHAIINDGSASKKRILFQLQKASTIFQPLKSNDGSFQQSMMVHFPPLKASTIFEAAQFQNTTSFQRFGVDKGWNRIFIQICSTRNKSSWRFMAVQLYILKPAYYEYLWHTYFWLTTSHCQLLSKNSSPPSTMKFHHQFILSHRQN